MSDQPAGEHHPGTLNLTGEGNEAESSPISEEAVDAAARVFYGGAWDVPDKGMNDALRSGALEALTAALPALRRQIAEEIAAKGDEIASGYQTSAEYYRSLSIETGSAEPKGQRYMRTAHSFKDRAAGAWDVAHAARDIDAQ